MPAAVMNAIPAGKKDSVIEYDNKLNKGQEVETDWGLYYQLRTDRRLLKNTNLMALKDKLGNTEFKQLADMQQSQLAPGAHTTSVRSAADILHGFMLQAGIDPNPKPDQKDQAATVGRIWSAFEQRVADFESLNGRKAHTQDLEKLAGQMFIQVPVKSWLYGSEDKPAVLVDQAKDTVVVPEADRRQIVEALQQTYPGRRISEDDVWVAFMKGKGLL